MTDLVYPPQRTPTRFGAFVERVKSVFSGVPSNTLGPLFVREPFAGAWQKNIAADNQRTILAFSAVYACVALRSRDVAKLRLKLIRQNDDYVWEEVREQSPYWKVLRKPNDFQTRIQFVSQWVASKLMHGNAYVFKEREAARGMVRALYVLNPTAVTPKIAEDGSVWYTLAGDTLSGLDESITVPASEIIHDRGPTFFHPLVGVSPIYAAGMSATMGIRIQKNSMQFFENMSTPSGQLTAPGKIPDDTAARLKKEFEDRFSGGGFGRVFVTGNGLKYEPMSIAAVDAQLIEQLRMTVDDIARCFVPATKIITIDGVKRIDEVRVGDRVLTHMGRWRSVEQVIKNDYVGRAFAMRAKGLSAVIATGNHPFYAQTVRPGRSHRLQPIGRPEWLRADELRVSRYQRDGARARGSFHALTMPKLGACGESGTLDLAQWKTPNAVIDRCRIKASTNHRATSVRRILWADYALGWICGLYIADGTKGHHQVHFTLGEHEVDIVAALTKRLRDVFDVGCSVRVTRGMAIVTVSNQIVREFFVQFGTGAHNKAMPAWCMEQSAEFQKGVIDGVVDGDGCVDRACTNVKTTSERLVWQLRLLLWAREINTSVVKHAARGVVINGIERQSRECYTVSWREEKTARGTMGLAHDVSFFALDECVPMLYQGPVYNLEVEEDHSYATVGGIAHNCFAVPLHKINAGAPPTFNNIGALNQDYYSQSLQEDIESIELLLEEGLALPSGLGIEFDLEGLLRMDPISRSQRYGEAIRAGWMTINEARFAENMSPVEGGDQVYMQQQMFPLKTLEDQAPPGAAPQAGGGMPDLAALFGGGGNGEGNGEAQGAGEARPEPPEQEEAAAKRFAALLEAKLFAPRERA
jgi:HK97 family phage portal protein